MPTFRKALKCRIFSNNRFNDKASFKFLPFREIGYILLQLFPNYVGSTVSFDYFLYLDYIILFFSLTVSNILGMYSSGFEKISGVLIILSKSLLTLSSI